jgi:hypothetical protein
LLTELADFSTAALAFSVASIKSFCAEATASVNGLLEYEETDLGAATPGCAGIAAGVVGFA